MNKRDFYRFEINRILHLKDSQSNRDKIDRFLLKLRSLPEHDQTIEDKVIEIVCSILRVDRKKLTQGRIGRDVSDAKKFISHYLYYTANYTDHYNGNLLGIKRSACFYARMSLESSIEFDKDLRSKWNQFNEIMKSYKNEYNTL